VRSRARSSRLPRKLLKGQKMLDGMTGEEIYQRDATTRYQRGMYLHKKNYDQLTTQQMEEMLQTTVSGQNMTYQSGQGNEKPNYSNLPKFNSDALAIAAGYVIGMPYLLPDGTLTHVGLNQGGQGQGNVFDNSGNQEFDSSGNPLEA